MFFVHFIFDAFDAFFLLMKIGIVQLERETAKFVHDDCSEVYKWVRYSFADSKSA